MPARASHELYELAERMSPEYARADPFPHAVLDGLFASSELEAVADEFPDPDDSVWKTYTAPAEAGKQEASSEPTWGPRVRALVEYLRSSEWIGFVERLTGCSGLVADAHGGGMHQSTAGARLDVHADFNRHPELDLDRLVNAIVFLNPRWTADAGGCLELWGSHGCVRSIVPELNRCVIFSASETSFHGHPVPVAGGLDPATGQPRRRRSVAVYYYGRREGERPPAHSTVWFRAVADQLSQDPPEES